MKSTKVLGEAIGQALKPPRLWLQSSTATIYAHRYDAANDEAWGTKIGLPATRWMLEIGAFFMRTETELLLKSRRVVPGRLLEAGFTFRFPVWEEAAKDLCRRWREKRRRKAALPLSKT